MKNKYLTIAIVSILAFGANTSSFAGDMQLNVRQSIGNGSMNKISSARLKGMFADVSTEEVKTTKEFGRRGCVTSIGNQQSGNSLMGKPQDVNILGDITNVCF